MVNYPNRQKEDEVYPPTPRVAARGDAKLAEVIRKKVEAGELDADSMVTWGALQKLLD